MIIRPGKMFNFRRQHTIWFGSVLACGVVLTCDQVIPCGDV